VCLNNLNRKVSKELENTMSVNLGHQTKKTARVRNLFGATLVLGCAFGTVTHAGAQTITTPTTPNAITPPAGNSAFLVGHAVGTQGYVCLPTSIGASTASWTVNASRPEATLYVMVFDRFVEVVTHFLWSEPAGIVCSGCPHTLLLSKEPLRFRRVAGLGRTHWGWYRG
jgi:hypothetical protein